MKSKSDEGENKIKKQSKKINKGMDTSNENDKRIGQCHQKTRSNASNRKR